MCDQFKVGFYYFFMSLCFFNVFLLQDEDIGMKSKVYYIVEEIMSLEKVQVFSL